MSIRPRTNMHCIDIWQATVRVTSYQFLWVCAIQQCWLL